MKINIRFVGALLGLSMATAFFVSGCGGGAFRSKGNGGSGGNGNGGAGTLTRAQIGVALKAVEAKFGSLPRDAASRENTNNQLLAFVRDRPEFEASGIDENADNVWARFTNGRMLVFATNRAPAPAAALAARPPVRRQALTARAELPTPVQVRLLNTLPASMLPANASIGALLSSSNGGYSLASSDAGVDALKNLGGDGVFYIDSHGGYVKPDVGNTYVYSVLTSTPVSTPLGPEIDAPDPYQEDLDAGRLTYFVHDPDDADRVTEEVTSYGITAEFVKRYIRFGENSFVFINACSSSFSASTTTGDFGQACLDAGASVYAGWTAPVVTTDANKAGIFAFQQLLGDGRQRGAIDVAALRTKMAENALDTSINGLSSKRYYRNAKLTFTSGGGFGLLAPRLDSASYDSSKKEVTLTGSFGSDPGIAGTVRVGSSVLSGKQWTPTQIVGKTNACGPNALNVKVEVRGHKSNQQSVSIACPTQGPIPMITPRPIP